jgi:hypothetical protein
MDLNSFWEYKMQVFPALIALGLVEIPNIIRKFKRFYYIPIYFPIFPLRELNPNLAYYLGEDYFIGYGATLEKHELEILKRKIMIDSAVAIFISAIAIPSIAGFVLALFLNTGQISQAIFVIIVYKSFNIIKAIIGFKQHAVASGKNIIILIFIYIGFLGVFYQLFINSYDWARPFIINENYKGLFSSLTNLIFNKGVAQGLILAGLAAFFSNLITDKKIRDENIRNSK